MDSKFRLVKFYVTVSHDNLKNCTPSAPEWIQNLIKTLFRGLKRPKWPPSSNFVITLQPEKLKLQINSPNICKENIWCKYYLLREYSSSLSAAESSTLMTTDDGTMSSSSTSNNYGVVLLQSLRTKVSPALFTLSWVLPFIPVKLGLDLEQIAIEGFLALTCSLGLSDEHIKNPLAAGLIGSRSNQKKFICKLKLWTAAILNLCNLTTFPVSKNCHSKIKIELIMSNSSFPTPKNIEFCETGILIEKG
ncbi:hypothetical protein GQR58_020258 [Nymphon striatum]|nr:hypothetical protein GQR58_020258 [Nymphon striatum]